MDGGLGGVCKVLTRHSILKGPSLSLSLSLQHCSYTLLLLLISPPAVIDPKSSVVVAVVSTAAAAAVREQVTLASICFQPLLPLPLQSSSK